MNCFLRVVIDIGDNSNMVAKMERDINLYTQYSKVYKHKVLYENTLIQSFTTP